MNYQHVKFTDRLTKVIKDFKDLPYGEVSRKPYLNLSDYILDKKAEYFTDFETFMVNRIQVLYPEIYSEANQTSQIETKNLIIDCMSKDFNRIIKVGTAKYNKNWFIGLTVTNMMWIAPIQNKFFKFEDLSINYISDNIDINSSILHSNAVKYIKDMIKPNPILDKLDDEERNIFKGVF
jgi:hypothetical protein